MEDDLGTNGTNQAPPPPEPAPPAEPTPPPTPHPPAPEYPPPPTPGMPNQGGIVPSDKNKVAAGVLAILLGSLGIHKFYMGYTTEGIILLAVSLVSFGFLSWATAIVGIIEGIIYLTMTDEQWYGTYIAGRKKWF